VRRPKDYYQDVLSKIENSSRYAAETMQMLSIEPDKFKKALLQMRKSIDASDKAESELKKVLNDPSIW